jgi:hypothetical protein
MALAICLIIIIAPFLVKSYINNNGEELTGRKLELGGLYHNPLTGYTRLRDFKMMELQDTAVFLSFDTLVINLDLYKMIGKTFSISEIRLANPQIQINKLDTIFNYTDLALRFTEESGEPEEPEDDSPLDVELKNISLAGGVLSFHNLVTGRQWLFDDIDAAIPGLYFDNQNTDVDLDLTLRDGGELLSSTEYNNELGTFKIHLELGNINLSPLQTFIKEYLDISDFGGSMDAEIDISGEVGDLDQLLVSGKVDVNDYYFEDPDGKRFLFGEKVTTVMEEIIPMKYSVVIESITASKPGIFYEMYVDSTDNIRPLIIEQEAEETEETATEDSVESSGLDLLIKTLRVDDGNFDFKDHNPESPFEYQFSNIAVDIQNVSDTDTTKLTMEAKAPDDGEVSLYWEGNFFDLDQQAFTLKTNIPGLPAFSPYTISFFDVPIDKGSFNYTSTNHIDHGNLEGLHTILASNITLGEKKGFESLYDVPIKIGLYLLEDKDGNIHLEIPVEGTTDDPEFRYTKIVVDAVINGIVKLVTSPISLIGKLVGAGNELDDLSYDPLNVEITPEFETKMNYLAEALLQKPQLKVKMIQHFDPEQAGKDVAVHLVKEDYYKESHGNTDVMDYYAVSRVDLKDDEFAQYISGKAKAEIKNDEDLATACYDLKQKQVQSVLDTIPQGWNNLVIAFLNDKGVPQGNIQIETQEDKEGKFEYELEADMLEDLEEVAAADSTSTAEVTSD